MRVLIMATALVALPALPFLSARAQDSASRNLAASCAICHGTEGRAVAGEFVPLAGVPKERIVEQMKAFRDGARPATVMHQIAKGYNDAQIDALAAWFAAQKR